MEQEQIAAEGVELMSIQDLALNARWTEDGLKWVFPTAAAARKHLRRYENLLATWAYRFQMPTASIVVDSGNPDDPATQLQSWKITSRDYGIDTEVNPLVSIDPQQIEEDPDYLVVAEQRLGTPLIRAIMEMREHPGIKAIVNWTTQKQVILTRDCNSIPIGEQLEECLRYSRYDYWVSADLDEFLRRCRRELNQDGSNSIEFADYLTFDPTTGGDWIKITGRYRMIDCGRLGMYQIGENIAFEHVEAPAIA